MGTKKDNENKRELAKMLYVGGSEVAEIATRVGVSRQSVSAWISKGGWKELRAARSITRPELVNKLLVTINNLIEDVNTGDDPASVSGLADKLVKLSSVIERLDKKANIPSRQSMSSSPSPSGWSFGARATRRLPFPSSRS